MYENFNGIARGEASQRGTRISCTVFTRLLRGCLVRDSARCAVQYTAYSVYGIRLDFVFLFLFRGFASSTQVVPKGAACMLLSCSWSLLIHMLEADLDSSPVRLQLLDLGKLHDRTTNITQSLRRQVRARNVLHERAQVDARVLLCKAVRCCAW